MEAWRIKSRYQTQQQWKPQETLEVPIHTETGTKSVIFNREWKPVTTWRWAVTTFRSCEPRGMAHPQGQSASGSVEMPQRRPSRCWGTVQQNKIFPKKCNNRVEYQPERQQLRRCRLLTALLLYSDLPPEPKASLGRLLGFILRTRGSKATRVSSLVQTPACSRASSSGPAGPQLCSPNQPSAWLAVALPCCTSERDRRCWWHWNVTSNATKHRGARCPPLPLKGYLPLGAQNCIKTASSSFKWIREA